MLEFITRETGDQPDTSIIWLHGLGADGHDFEPVVPELNLSPSTSVRFIFPHAPQQPVTINGGMVMRSWYDILSMEIARQVDESGIDQSSGLVRELIEMETKRGIRSDRIILAGFSQGGAIALHTALLYTQPLMGVIALSTYLPVPRRLDSDDTSVNRNIPVFMGHGTADPVVPVQLGHQSRNALVAKGYAVAWHDYPIPHSVNLEELRDIGQWVSELLTNKAAT